VDEGLNVGMGMPGWLLYPATLLALLVLAYPFYRARSLIARYALFALSFRYLAGAHHTVTFMASPIGMSWNAIGSSGVFLMGLVLIKARHLLLKQLIPFYLLVIAVVLSALGNHNISGMLDVVVKYGYLIIITIAVYEALSRMGEQRGMGLLLWAMVTPVLFQVLSIAFGITKGSEADGSISFIGGYHHESPFSIVLATGFVIACFATGMKVWVRGAILLVLLMGLVLANYRTVLIAIAPLAFVQFNLDFIGRFPKRQRIIIGIAVLGFSSLGALAAAWVMRERFTDLLTVLSDPGALIKEPQYYTPDERKLMSGRPYIWAAYIDGYLDGGAKTLLVGYGPSAWVGRFAIYAHNTLVSTLYEYPRRAGDDLGLGVDVRRGVAGRRTSRQAADGACQLLPAQHGDDAALDAGREHPLRHHLRLYLLPSAVAGEGARAPRHVNAVADGAADTAAQYPQIAAYLKVAASWRACSIPRNSGCPARAFAIASLARSSRPFIESAVA
jgi:hypothetical protein